MRLPLGAVVVLAATVVVLLAWGVLWLLAEVGPLERLRGPAPADGRVPLALLGDSDSHAYQDRLSFGADAAARGGRYRPTTLQWTEVLHRLRGDALDLGQWGVWGVPNAVARVQAATGVPPARAPRREDFGNAMAISGARCGGLTGSEPGQLAPLLQRLDADPERWRRGVVSIRIGANPLGFSPALDAFAQAADDPGASATLEACIEDVRRAVATLRGRHPQTRIVLVGLFDNSHWARYRDRWHSPEALRRIGAAIDRYDAALRALERAHPSQVAFFDDRAWFAALWGGRDPHTGQPAYREVTVGRGLRVANTQGDAPTNAVLADGHAGTAWNALWAQAFVALLNQRFGLAIRPIDDAEIAALVDPEGRFGAR